MIHRRVAEHLADGSGLRDALRDVGELPVLPRRIAARAGNGAAGSMKGKRDVRIPRLTWSLLAYENQRFADELRWLLGRSLQCLQAGLDGKDGFAAEPPAWPDDPRTQQAARARVRAEVAVELEPDRATPGGTELRCLLLTLERLEALHSDAARTLPSLARRTAKQPMRGPRALVELAGCKWLPPIKQGGRPRLDSIPDAPLLIAVAQRAPGATERAAIEAFLRRTLHERGKRHGSDATVRSLTTRLQKRLIALRKPPVVSD